MTLTVADDGVGLPADCSAETSPGFGLQLVALLARQLGGQVRFERDQGTRAVLEFTRCPGER